MATVYISSSGSDSYTYAQAQNSATPWLTIGKANTSATTGDTIIILNSITLASVSFTKSFTITGNSTNPFNIVLDGGGGNIAWTFSTGISITCNNLRFTNVVKGNSAGSALFTLRSVSSVTLTLNNCVIDTMSGAHNDNANPSGIFVIGPGITAGTGNYITLTNCTIYGITKTAGGTRYGVVSVATGQLSTITVNNCTFYNSEPTNRINAFLDNTTSNLYSISVKNTIFADTASAVVSSNISAFVASYSYNDYFGTISTPTSTFSITSDPLFVDPANGNFNLRPTSPCIDTGTLV